MNGNNLLEIKDLKISFPYNGGNIQVVRGVDLVIMENDIVGILGESGSGKTVTATSILGLTRYDGGRIDSGEIIYKGTDTDILKLDENSLRKLRGKEISYIFQNPVDTLNPYRKIGKQLEEVQKVHKQPKSKVTIMGILEDLGLERPELIYDMYPSQLSGGQCQRIAIAMSLIGNCKIIIADEPTSSIDASMQGLAIELLRTINKKFNVTIIVITHNFEVVKSLCNKVIIMYGGLIMEKGNVEDIINNPLNPYTKALIECVKSVEVNDKTLYTLEGRAPTPQEFKEECPFLSRCSSKTTECGNGIPALKLHKDGREVRCIQVK